MKRARPWGRRITQDEIESGELSETAIREAGLKVFATPFNSLDGLGDGPMDPGGRPTLDGNGMFLRLNGLDSQSCLECHSVLSASEVPARFAVGGAGPVATNAMPGMLNPDIADSEGNGFATTRGRFINPPFVFGSGGIEQLGHEMTDDLLALRDAALARPGSVIPLVTKGISFGEISCSGAGDCDSSEIAGIDEDLIVRPFGRKGSFATTRDFDTAALMFHHGMQPVEVVGEDVDADGDGVPNEILVGELSALHIFSASLAPPRQLRVRGVARLGREIFEEIGCADCHVPSLDTQSRQLDFHRPGADAPYYEVSLNRGRGGFAKIRDGGVRVSLFADLKRHDMGPDLAENTDSPTDAFFTTARLWGVADTAPYLHDGRATLLSEAILMHGGEALDAADDFALLTESDASALIAYLRTLRTPEASALEIRRRGKH